MIKIKINKFALIEIIEKICISIGIREKLKEYNEIRIIIYLAGLIALSRPTTTSIARHFTSISHDALTRELNEFRWMDRSFIINYIQSIQSKTAEAGYLIIDDTVLRKPYARLIPGLWWVWDGIAGKSVLGYHVVTVLWSNGKIKVPVGYKVWEPKIFAKPYKTKVDLAIELIKEIHTEGLKVDYVAFDNWYSSRKLLKVLKKCNYHWVTRSKNNRKILFQKTLTSPKNVRKKFNENQFHYYSAIRLYIKVIQVRIRGYGGMLKLVIVKNGRSANLQNTRFILTDLLSFNARQILGAYQSRWSLETVFRDLKQFLGFEKCQMSSWNKVIGHLEATFLAYFILDFIKNDRNISTIPELVRQLQGLISIYIQGAGNFTLNTYNIDKGEENIIKTIHTEKQEQTTLCHMLFR